MNQVTSQPIHTNARFEFRTTFKNAFLSVLFVFRQLVDFNFEADEKRYTPFKTKFKKC